MNNSFCSTPMLQSWGDVAFWELVLNAHPELKGIVELGTYYGGFSRFLGFQAKARQLRFATLDRNAPPRPPPGFVQLDLWDPRAPDAVRSLLPRLGILLCDNGDKPREVQTFGPLLERGELLAVHDWGTEIGPGDVPASFEMLHEHDALQYESATRVFRRR